MSTRPRLDMGARRTSLVPAQNQGEDLTNVGVTDADQGDRMNET